MKTICPICQTDTHDRQVYDANFKIEDINAEVFSARRIPDRLHYRMVTCVKCGLLRANPVLSQEVLSGLYKDSHGHQVQLSKAAADTYEYYFDKNFSDFPSQGKILEIGCGPGFFLKALFKKNKHQIFGVEPSYQAIEQAGEIKGMIYHGMFQRGIYPREFFDIICGFQMFDHLPDPAQFLKDCRKYLKPDGHLFLIMHDQHAWPARILGRQSPIVDIEHPMLYNPQTIVKMIEANGFTVQKKFSVLNRYPLRYWLQLMPLPKAAKNLLLHVMQKNPLGDIPLNIKAGNMGIIVKPSPLREE